MVGFIIKRIMTDIVRLAKIPVIAKGAKRLVYKVTVDHYATTYCITSAFLGLYLYYENINGESAAFMWILHSLLLTCIRMYSVKTEEYPELQRLRQIENTIEILTRYRNEQIRNNPELAGCPSFDEVFSLPHIHMKESGYCCICLDTIDLKETITNIGCTHKFHSKCIDVWILNNPTCPVCKIRVNFEKKAKPST
ncbi:unnamed protein product [Blepharisma stoltei]|uniref:RING-type E3 ubiquitin transferase n=1 Tax=Blepharisma stoltei TaxID=1481888 RepID=A0AAU9JUU8_9CILI|nr:unnamed protein product [Blepharisma stoltei]